MANPPEALTAAESAVAGAVSDIFHPSWDIDRMFPADVPDELYQKFIEGLKDPKSQLTTPGCPIHGAVTTCIESCDGKDAATQRVAIAGLMENAKSMLVGSDTFAYAKRLNDLATTGLSYQTPEDAQLTTEVLDWDDDQIREIYAQTILDYDWSGYPGMGPVVDTFEGSFREAEDFNTLYRAVCVFLDPAHVEIFRRNMQIAVIKPELEITIVDPLKKEVADLTSKRDQLQSELEDKKDELEQAETDYQKLEESKETELRELREQLEEEKENAIQGLKSDHADEVDRLEGDISQAGEDYQALEVAKARELRELREALVGEKETELRELRSEHEQAVEQLKDQISDLEGDVRAADQRADEAKEKLTERVEVIELGRWNSQAYVGENTTYQSQRIARARQRLRDDISWDKFFAIEDDIQEFVDEDITLDQLLIRATCTLPLTQAQAFQKALREAGASNGYEWDSHEYMPPGELESTYAQRIAAELESNNWHQNTNISVQVRNFIQNPGREMFIALCARADAWLDGDDVARLEDIFLTPQRDITSNSLDQEMRPEDAPYLGWKLTKLLEDYSVPSGEPCQTQIEEEILEMTRTIRNEKDNRVEIRQAFERLRIYFTPSGALDFTEKVLNPLEERSEIGYELEEYLAEPAPDLTALRSGIREPDLTASVLFGPCASVFIRFYDAEPQEAAIQLREVFRAAPLLFNEEQMKSLQRALNRAKYPQTFTFANFDRPQSKEPELFYPLGNKLLEALRSFRDDPTTANLRSLEKTLRKTVNAPGGELLRQVLKQVHENQQWPKEPGVHHAHLADELITQMLELFPSGDTPATEVARETMDFLAQKSEDIPQEQRVAIAAQGLRTAEAIHTLTEQWKEAGTYSALTLRRTIRALANLLEGQLMYDADVAAVQALRAIEAFLNSDSTDFEALPTLLQQLRRCTNLELVEQITAILESTAENGGIVETLYYISEHSNLLPFAPDPSSQGLIPAAASQSIKQYLDRPGEGSYQTMMRSLIDDEECSEGQKALMGALVDMGENEGRFYHGISFTPEMGGHLHELRSVLILGNAEKLEALVTQFPQTETGSDYMSCLFYHLMKEREIVQEYPNIDSIKLRVSYWLRNPQGFESVAAQSERIRVALSTSVLEDLVQQLVDIMGVDQLRDLLKDDYLLAATEPSGQSYERHAAQWESRFYRPELVAQLDLQTWYQEHKRTDLDPSHVITESSIEQYVTPPAQLQNIAPLLAVAPDWVTDEGLIQLNQMLGVCVDPEALQGYSCAEHLPDEFQGAIAQTPAALPHLLQILRADGFEEGEEDIVKRYWDIGLMKEKNPDSITQLRLALAAKSSEFEGTPLEPCIPLLLNQKLDDTLVVQVFIGQARFQPSDEASNCLDDVIQQVDVEFVRTQYSALIEILHLLQGSSPQEESPNTHLDLSQGLVEHPLREAEVMGDLLGAHPSSWAVGQFIAADGQSETVEMRQQFLIQLLQWVVQHNQLPPTVTPPNAEMDRLLNAVMVARGADRPQALDALAEYILNHQAEAGVLLQRLPVFREIAQQRIGWQENIDEEKYDYKIMGQILQDWVTKPPTPAELKLEDKPESTRNLYDWLQIFDFSHFYEADRQEELEPFFTYLNTLTDTSLIALLEQRVLEPSLKKEEDEQIETVRITLRKTSADS